MERAVVMKPSDNVATCLTDLEAGATENVTISGSQTTIRIADDISFGHKIALVDIAAGDAIIKYAEVIGVASRAIARGEHVHIPQRRKRSRARRQGMTQFLGYRRPDGRVGVRNIVAVISAMDNTNPSADRIASIIPNAQSVTTPFGRTQIGEDFEITLRTLAGIGCHPNVGAVLVLGLSLTAANVLADRIRPVRQTGRGARPAGGRQHHGTDRRRRAGRG